MNVGRYIRGEDRHVGTARITTQGVKTAQVILGNDPASLDEFYRYPRTMEEAFGPGERGAVDEPTGLDLADEVVLKASAGGFAVLLLLHCAGALP